MPKEDKERGPKTLALLLYAKNISSGRPNCVPSGRPNCVGQLLLKGGSEQRWAASPGLLSQPRPLNAAPELGFPLLFLLCLGVVCGNGPAVCAV